MVSQIWSIGAVGSLFVSAAALAGGPPDVVINEIRVDQSGTDNDEFFELVGPADQPLTGLTYIVISDSGPNGGIIEAVVPLGGSSINATGFFFAAEATFSIPDTPAPDLVTNLNFENSDNVTHALVSGFTGMDGQDIDFDDDGILDEMPWGEVLSVISLVEDPCGGDPFYGSKLGGIDFGPDGPFVPAMVSRCSPDADAWVVGEFDAASLFAIDTPGEPNEPCPPDDDADGVLDDVDNCDIANPDQADCDGDGEGDVCEIDSGDQLDENMNGVPDVCERIIITEIHADPDDVLGDANGDGTADFIEDEFVEIYNNSGGPLDLSGWTLSDSFELRHTFPPGTIIPDQCGIVLFAGGTPIGLFGGAATQVSTTGDLGLQAGGDDVILQDGSAVIQAFYRYPLPANVCGQSMTRDPDLFGTAMVAHTTATGAGGALFSPGTFNDGSSFPGCPPPIDTDMDGVPDFSDNCPDHPNPDQADCDGDGKGDVCAIADGDSFDCNQNDTPDECDIADGVVQDCDQSGVPDICEDLPDDNMNGVPDICEVPPPAGLRINEIRASQPDADLDEYFELKGSMGQDLTGLRYLVIGDSGDDISGVIEAIVNLDAESVPLDGHYLAVEDTFTLAPLLAADLVLGGEDNGLNFEGSDNVTHVLVTNFFGTIGQDVDTDNDGILDVMPWLVTVDAVGLVEDPTVPPSGTGWVYGTTLGGADVGPDGPFVPGQVHRCETAGDWNIGDFDPFDAAAVDTPGSTNVACAGSCPEDIDGDLDIDFQDLLLLLAAWSPAPGSCAGCPEDIDGDDDVDFQDLLLLLAAWGDC
jgi:hypothetical protein